MGYDMCLRGGDDYLHRNIWFMAELRAALLETGAAFDDYEFASPWTGHWSSMMPYPGDEHFELQQVEDEVDEDGSPLLSPDYERPTTGQGRAYADEAERRLSWRPERAGIPIHKLCSNDGWIVTAAECREALDSVHEYEETHALPEAFDDDVLPFLRTAAAADDFEVE